MSHNLHNLWHISRWRETKGSGAHKVLQLNSDVKSTVILENGYVPSSDSCSIHRSPNRISWVGYLLLSTVLAASSLTSVKEDDDDDDDEISATFRGLAGRPVATIIGTA